MAQSTLPEQLAFDFSPIPAGYCRCGCGGQTPPAARDSPRVGQVKGQPTRFLTGHHLRPSFEQRFLAGVLKGADDACWPWQGCTTSGGYGVLARGRTMYLAHRVAWEREHGPIPEGSDVLHRCDNPPCCNHGHLFLGTQIDNAADMVRKGRQAFGEKHGCSKLTEDAVRVIRAAYANGASRSEIARVYRVDRHTLGFIVKNQTWKHVM